MIDRQLEREISILRQEFPIIAILGPRQSGKTTLARKQFPEYTYISLEDIDHREFAKNDPRGFLQRYPHHVILDEIQRVPDLFSYLQTHVDQNNQAGQIVITGSHNFLLMERITQSLAGRVGITRLMPFSLFELQDIKQETDEFLFKGFYPRIYDQMIRPGTFYKNYVSTYIEKDVRQLKQLTKIDDFTRFIHILAGRNGQELNLSSVSEQTGVSHTTVREWISVLEASFLIFRLRPYHKNYNKRVVKNPKIYFTDPGLVCHLLGIREQSQIQYHYMRGALFETLVVTEILKGNLNSGERFGIFFWRDHHRKEVDMILEMGQKIFCIEIKSSQTINSTSFKGLNYWRKLARVDDPRAILVYAGTESYIRENTLVLGWRDVFSQLMKPVLAPVSEP